MRMVNDFDRYYEKMYKADTTPMWMKDERIAYCDSVIMEEKNSIWNKICKVFR